MPPRNQGQLANFIRQNTTKTLRMTGLKPGAIHTPHANTAAVAITANKAPNEVLDFEALGDPTAPNLIEAIRKAANNRRFA